MASLAQTQYRDEESCKDEMETRVQSLQVAAATTERGLPFSVDSRFRPLAGAFMKCGLFLFGVANVTSAGGGQFMHGLTWSTLSLSYILSNGIAPHYQGDNPGTSAAADATGEVRRRWGESVDTVSRSSGGLRCARRVGDLTACTVELLENGLDHLGSSWVANFRQWSALMTHFRRHHSAALATALSGRDSVEISRLKVSTIGIGWYRATYQKSAWAVKDASA